MSIIKHILNLYPNTEQLNLDYVKSPPYPRLVLDNFLPSNIIDDMKEECSTMTWTREFTRNGSRMLERQDISDCDVALKVYQQLSSKQFLDWLGAVTGHYDLIPDPHMIGAGYMRCGTGDSLKLHSDFNYNNTLHLYRLLSVNIYLNKEWKEEWNGDLQFYDFERKKCLAKYFPIAGRAIIWRHHKYGFHGHPNPITCPQGIYRDGFRMFYYVSHMTNYKLDKTPHRSLYWFDEKNGKPYDVAEEK